MMRYVALLRAVNVGGTGTLRMVHLRSLCGEAGFSRVETFIASGNVVFESKLSAARVKAEIEARLLAYAGKSIGVMIRTGDEMAAVLAANPFPEAQAKFVHAIFLDRKPPYDALEQARGRTDEEMRLGVREIYVHYSGGAGRSKLRIPAAQSGTARNMNTVGKLVELALRMPR